MVPVLLYIGNTLTVHHVYTLSLQKQRFLTKKRHKEDGGWEQGEERARGVFSINAVNCYILHNVSGRQMKYDYGGHGWVNSERGIPKYFLS
jgi:hypothetical protein